jgi:hypothetical protein
MSARAIPNAENRWKVRKRGANVTDTSQTTHINPNDLIPSVHQVCLAPRADARGATRSSRHRVSELRWTRPRDTRRDRSQHECR